MHRFVRIPFLFLFLASVIGVLLRWQFISPISGINYSNFLHSHSHIMFLGWVFNALYIAFAIIYIDSKDHRPFNILFIILQILVVAMMISFPLQGYGKYSIIFSSLHTFGALAFVYMFLAKTKHIQLTSVWFVRTSLFFFVLSTLGPFSLGYIMAKGLGNTEAYNFSIYFYLHFQYNGFFLFGVFALFFSHLENNDVNFNASNGKAICSWMAIACIPAYLLSTLWAKPSLIFNYIGAVSSIAQCIALALLISFLKKNWTQIKTAYTRQLHLFLWAILIAFVIKLILQLLSAHPYIAQMAYQLRPIVIAYLHLVLIGVISLSVMVWYIEKSIIEVQTAKRILLIFLISFVAMELVLVLSPSWSVISIYSVLPASHYLFLLSVMLATCSLSLYLFSSTAKFK